MDNEYEHVKTASKKATSKKIHKSGNTVRQKSETNDDERDKLMFYQWEYDEHSGFVLNSLAHHDEYDMECGEIVSLGSKNRWELPKIIQKAAEKSQYELKNNFENFHGPLVIYYEITNEIPKYGYGSGPNSTKKHMQRLADEAIPELSSSEEEVEFEVIRNRKGREVRLKEPKKKEEPRCSFIESLTPAGKKYEGIVHVFYHRVTKLTSLDYQRTDTTCVCCRIHPPSTTVKKKEMRKLIDEL